MEAEVNNLLKILKIHTYRIRNNRISELSNKSFKASFIDSTSGRIIHNYLVNVGSWV